MGRFYASPEEEQEFEKWKKEHPFQKILFYFLFGPIVGLIGILIYVLYIVSMYGQFIFSFLGIYVLIGMLTKGELVAGILGLIIFITLSVLCSWIYEYIRHRILSN